MCLVNLGGNRFGRARVLELVRLRRVPKASIIYGRHAEILGHPLDPSREAIDTLAVTFDHGDLCVQRPLSEHHREKKNVTISLTLILLS